MNMNFNNLFVINYYNAVADSLKIRSKLVRVGSVLYISAYNKLCAVSELNIIVKFSSRTFKIINSSLFFCLGVLNHYTVLKVGKHTLKDYTKALTACVNNSCLFKNR